MKKLSRQAFVMSTLKTLLQVLGKNAILTNYSAIILVENMAPIHVKGWEGTRGNNPGIVIHKAEQTQQFFIHLNSLDPNIQFITESPDQQGYLPSLATLTSQGPHGILITMVYRKPTQTDQYLHWDSHHSITHKYNIYNTLSHMAQYICSNQQLLKQENQHIQTALHRYNFPDWVFHRLQAKMEIQLIQKQW